MKHIHLANWSQFAQSLSVEVRILQVGDLVVVRNFAKVTFSQDDEEQDRLQIAIETGTDRDTDSALWNVPGFDHEHDISNVGKAPNEIIYAFTIDLSQTPYLVRHDVERPEAIDIAADLTEHDAILVYDPRMLERRTKNEYWFNSKPLDAALLLYTAL